MAHSHEEKDIDVRGVLISGVGLAAIILVGLGAGFVFFKIYEYFEKITQKPCPLMAPARVIPPEPRLEVLDGTALKALRKEEKEILENYGWADKNTGAVRIPIEQAMDLIAQRGLPYKEEKKK